MIDNSPEKPPKLDYAPPGDNPGNRYTLTLAIAAVIGGYFVAVAAGLILLGGEQGPIPFLCTLWPVLVTAGILLGKYLDRRRGAQAASFNDHEHP